MNLDEAYKIAVETRNMEIELFWKRSNYFLALNIAIAIAYFRVNETFYTIVISMLGVIAALLWCFVNLGSKYWQSRWERRTAILEDRVDRNAEFELFNASWETIDRDVKESLSNNRRRINLSFIDKFVLIKPSVTYMMFLLSICFVVLWIIVAAWSIFSGLTANEALQLTAQSAAALWVPSAGYACSGCN